MNSPRFLSLLLFSAAFAAGGLVAAHAEESTSTVKFSDPNKPGTLKILTFRGDVRIEGGDAAEVVVKSDGHPKRHERQREDGMRVLTETATFSLAEKDNLAVLDAASDGSFTASSDFRISVPRGTNIVITSNFGGDVTCNGLNGDLEIKGMQGDVQLTDIAGGVLVETMNGDISAAFRDLQAGKAISFTSMNGKVALRVPVTAKANVRFRTQNGSIATDFDEDALVTKVENMPGMHGKSTRSLNPKTREALVRAGQAAAEVAQRTMDAANEALEAAQAGVEAQMAASNAATAKVEKDDVSAKATTITAAPAKPSGPVAPKAPATPRIPTLPSIPAMTGGKLVTGTLNGGGPEISVATMNGDVTLRKIK